MAWCGLMVDSRELNESYGVWEDVGRGEVLRFVEIVVCM